jgi:hypothetical protein
VKQTTKFLNRRGADNSPVLRGTDILGMKQPDDTFELPSVKLLVSRETGILGPNLLRTEKSLFHVKPLPQDLADELFHVEHVTEPAHMTGSRSNHGAFE